MIEQLKGNANKSTAVIIKIAAVVGAITVIAGGYSFILNNFYKPKITIVSADLDNGMATIKYRGKEIYLNGDDAHFLIGEWGIKIGANSTSNKYTTIELLKNGMVVEHLLGT